MMPLTIPSPVPSAVAVGEPVAAQKGMQEEKQEDSCGQYRQDSQYPYDIDENDRGLRLGGRLL